MQLTLRFYAALNFTNELKVAFLKQLLIFDEVALAAIGKMYKRNTFGFKGPSLGTRSALIK